MMITPKCFGCGKEPRQLAEYVEAARDEETTPNGYVRRGEGTYNPVTGNFYCTECYIKAGEPLGVAP